MLLSLFFLKDERAFFYALIIWFISIGYFKKENLETKQTNFENKNEKKIPLAENKTQKQIAQAENTKQKSVPNHTANTITHTNNA